MKVVPDTTIARLVKEKQMMLLLPTPRLEVAVADLNPQIGLLIGFALCWTVTADSVYTLGSLSLPLACPLPTLLRQLLHQLVGFQINP